jgi:hypothetical protein
MLVFFDASTLYLPLLDTATRSVDPPLWAWGQPVNVTLTVTAQNPGTSAVIHDEVPPGWQVDSVADGGAEVSPGVVEWVIDPWTAGGAVVHYTCSCPTWPLIPYVEFLNGYARDYGGGQIPVPPTRYHHVGVVVLQDGAHPATTYTGCQDAHVIVHSGGNNNTGMVSHLEEGHWNAPLEDHKKILIKFDTTVVPDLTPSSVTHAVLLMYYDHHRSGGSPVHQLRTQRIRRNWNEGTGSAYADGADVAQDGEVTWNSARHNQEDWSLQGLMDRTDVGPHGEHYNDAPYIPSFGDQTQVWVAFYVTNDVIDMVTDPASNEGWKLSQDKVWQLPWNHDDGVTSNPYATDPNGAAFDFTSSDNGDVVHRPMLLIMTEEAVPVEITNFHLF